MKKVKVLFIAAVLGLSFAVTSCTEEIIAPQDGEVVPTEADQGLED